MPKNFALVIDGTVHNVYRGVPDATTAAAFSPVNASRLFECGSEVGPGWQRIGSTFSPPVQPARRVIPALEFMDRMPKVKRIALREYAAGAGPVAQAAPQYVSEVADFLDRLRAAQEVSLDGDALRSALTLLKSIGLLTQAECDAMVV